MKEYLPVLEALGLPAQAGLLLTNEIQLPEPWAVDQPPSYRYFPPASIPLIGYANTVYGDDKARYWGVWAHWFTPGRSMTFAYTEMELGEGIRIREYARTFEQFVLRLLALRAEPDVQALKELAEQLEVPWDRVPELLVHRLSDSEREDLELEDEENADDESYEDEDRPAASLALEGNYVDSYDPMRQHPAFAGNLPRELTYEWPSSPWLGASHPYAGDWPDRDGKADPEALRRICGYEFWLTERDLADSAGKPWADYVGKLPPWLPEGGDQTKVFEPLLAAGDFQGAWMSLNSSSWDFDDARKAIHRLADAAGDPKFRLLADAWSAQEFELPAY